MPGKTTREALIARALARQAQGATQAEIAKEMGVHRKTVSDWLRSDEAAVMIEDAIAAARATLEGGATDAAETLLGLLGEENGEQVRLGAAKTILDRVGLVPGSKVETQDSSPQARPDIPAEVATKELRAIRGGKAE